MKLILAFGAVAATVVTMSAAVGGVSYASPRGNAPCLVPSVHYPTIQSAVSDTACGTVKVAPGMYTESVAIARSLTLIGARAGEDARRRRAGGGSTIVGGVHPAITITADNVTVDGFTLNGPADPGLAALVMQTANSGETIENNVVNNSGRAASITTSKTVFRDNVVKNTATAQDGFQANSTPAHDLTFSGNSFSGADPSGYNADITIIEGNANVTVADNRSTGDGTLIALFKTTGARITGNTVVGGGGSSAVYIGGANSKVTVSGNTISGAGSAVKVANSFGDGKNSGVTVTQNTLRNNQYGVNVASGSITDVVQVNRNSLTGNSLYGVFNDPASGQSTNATCNWWGALTGPSGTAGPGRGDKVSTQVTYKPWLILPSLNLSLICR